MNFQYRNFAFSGGGILGIAYIGMLDYLYSINVMQNIKRVAGTSAGAITACIASFNLPFKETKEIADSLDYKKVPSKSESISQIFSVYRKKELDSIFDNFDCVYRLIKDYGWFSSDYIYDWIKTQINNQFDKTKKKPPYTFLDFKNPLIHKDGRSFKELYIIGTDISTQTSTIFSSEYTPNMEVAQAVRISMSVPLFFEAVPFPSPSDNQINIYSDGGVMYNYPINLFDKYTPPYQTLGAIFESSCPPLKINNILDYIINLLACTSAIQTKLYKNSPLNIKRSIQIDTGDIAPLNFNINIGDKDYNFLYHQGYAAARNYFQKRFKNIKNI